MRFEPPRPGEWWYYTLDSGQHVRVYTAAALKALAARKNLHFVSNNRLHLYSRSRVPSWLFRSASSPLACGSSSESALDGDRCWSPTTPTVLAEVARLSWMLNRKFLYVRAPLKIGRCVYETPSGRKQS